MNGRTGKPETETTVSRNTQKKPRIHRVGERGACEPVESPLPRSRPPPPECRSSSMKVPLAECLQEARRLMADEQRAQELKERANKCSAKGIPPDHFPDSGGYIFRM
jgi:hypothetical protein